MPATSVAQQQFMGADLARLRSGKKTRTGMSQEQLEEFASTSHKGLPKKVNKLHMIRRYAESKRKP
jgi:hypothetical protein